jgi:hypothetical protein
MNVQRWLLPGDVSGWSGFLQGSSGVQREGSPFWFDDCHTLPFPGVLLLSGVSAIRALRFLLHHQPSPC